MRALNSYLQILLSRFAHRRVPAGTWIPIKLRVIITSYVCHTTKTGIYFQSYKGKGANYLTLSKVKLLISAEQKKIIWFRKIFLTCHSTAFSYGFLRGNFFLKNSWEKLWPLSSNQLSDARTALCRTLRVTSQNQQSTISLLLVYLIF